MPIKLKDGRNKIQQMSKYTDASLIHLVAQNGFLECTIQCQNDRINPWFSVRGQQWCYDKTNL